MDRQDAKQWKRLIKVCEELNEQKKGYEKYHYDELIYAIDKYISWKWGRAYTYKYDFPVKKTD